MRSTFRSLGVFNYRLWFFGALVSNIGAWMQRTAQDWIVLTELTDQDAVAVGVTMALQFGPLLVISPFAGVLVDRVSGRKLLAATQIAQGVLGLALGVITVIGLVQLWMVYVFALLLGVVTAIDNPTRQAFVSELVSKRDLPNAVSLNSASFNGARLFGPAVAGLLVALVGAGWVFLLNGLTFLGVLTALWKLRADELQRTQKAPRARGQFREGLRYVRGRADIVVVLAMVSLVGTFGFNFPVFTATMASVEFGHGAAEFGILSSVLAIGSLTGALLGARRERIRMRLISLAAAGFGIACVISAVMPTYELFGVSLILVGFASITMMTGANAYVQMTTPPQMRGRVMAIYMAIFVGGTPVGAPLIGWVANTFGPRWALGVAALSGIAASLIVLVWMFARRGLRLHYEAEARFRIVARWEAYDRELATSEIAVVEGTSRRAA